jgi:pimeloyl-ACP methyl ester carboxylesterase
MPPLEGIEHRFVDVDGLRFHVAVAGPPEGEPVVLLHGWPQHWYAWHKQVGPLAERFRVYCPDLRGFGWSDAPRDGYLKERMAEDVIALLDALGLERVHLAGHDWGGFIGFLICLRAPERVSSYLAIGISHPWSQPPPGPMPYVRTLGRFAYQIIISTPVVGRAIVQRIPGFVRGIFRLSAVDPGRTWNPAELESYVAQWSEPARAAACVGVYRTFLTRELLPLVRGKYRNQTMTTRSRLLVGEADPVIRPEMLAGNERAAPQLRIDIVPGVGHWVPEEAPDVVLEAMLELFGEASSPE